MSDAFTWYQYTHAIRTTRRRTRPSSSRRAHRRTLSGWCRSPIGMAATECAPAAAERWTERLPRPPSVCSPFLDRRPRPRSGGRSTPVDCSGCRPATAAPPRVPPRLDQRRACARVRRDSLGTQVGPTAGRNPVASLAAGRTGRTPPGSGPPPRHLLTGPPRSLRKARSLRLTVPLR
jgi:hypothetical protein